MAEHFGSDLILLERLAFGGMAEVFLAKTVGVAGFEKVVAVKRILPNLSALPHFRAMFEREAKICSHLQHPNIIQVFKNGEGSGHLYLVMEYVSGVTVLDLLEKFESCRELISVSLACYIVQEIALGLAYAHAFTDPLTGERAGLIHRDISPHNVMLSYTGEVKILDFGLARVADSADLTRSGEIKGKLSYMAPEVLEGDEPSSQSDLFSLGVVFFELLTARPLFDAESTVQTIKRVVECKVPSLSANNPTVPTKVEEILNRLLAREVTTRYSDAAEVAKDLGAVLREISPDFSSNTLASLLGKVFEVQIKEQQRVRKALLSGAVKIDRASFESTVVMNLKPKFSIWPPNLFVLGVIVVAVAMITVGVSYLYSRQAAAPVPVLPPTASTAVPIKRISLDAPALKFSSNIAGIARLDPSIWNVPDGAKVTRWPLGGEKFVIQSTPELAPTIRKGVLNGQSTIKFDGVDDYLIADDIVPTLRNCSKRTVYFVASTDRDKTQYILSTHRDDYVTDVFRLGFAPGHRIRIKQSPLDRAYSDSSPTVLDKFGIYVAFLSESGAELYRNGILMVESKQPGAPMATLANITIGQEWDNRVASDHFSGELAELIIYCRQITEPEHASLILYASERFGIVIK